MTLGRYIRIDAKKLAKTANEKAQGKSLGDLAKEAGLSVSTVRRVLDGVQNRMREGALIAVCKWLGAAPNDFTVAKTGRLWKRGQGRDASSRADTLTPRIPRDPRALIDPILDAAISEHLKGHRDRAIRLFIAALALLDTKDRA